MRDVERDFVTPFTATRPMLRWWWPGGAADTQALLGQLRRMHEAGFGGVEIQPFRIGLPHELPEAAAGRVHDVFTPGFFAKVAAVTAEAARLGMSVDMTFGSCWPFGGGEAITPELAATELTLAWTTVTGGQPWHGRPRHPERPLRSATWHERAGEIHPAQRIDAGWAERIARREQVVAVLGVRGGTPTLSPFRGFVPMTLPDAWGVVDAAGSIDASATVDLTDHVQADGSLSWDVPAGDWQIVVVKRFVIDQVICEAAGEGPQLVADHFKRAAFDAHAARVGDAGLVQIAPLTGHGLRAVFVDSLEIAADLHWSDDFEPEFHRRRGYALRPYLPLLLQPGWRNPFQARRGAPLFDDPEVGERVRADYRRTVSELILERTYAPFSQWAAKHGLQSRTQAHGAPCDWIAAYGLASMPETEDLMGGAGAHFLRLARSAALIYGREIASAEAFVWLVEGLAITPRQLRQRADDFFSAGVQQIIGHGASAPVAGLPETQAWFPWQGFEFGTMLDDHNPLWPMLRPFTDYIARIQTALRTGQARVPVAVLAPLDLFAFDGAGDRLTPPPWHDALLDAGYDWNWINDEGLLQGRIEPGALVTRGGHAFSAIVLPAHAAIDAAVAERLAQLADAGVEVVAIDQWPTRAIGLQDAAAADARVAEAVASLRAGAREAIGAAELGAVLRRRDVPPTLAISRGHGLRFVVRDDGACSWVWLQNPASETKVVRLGAGEDRHAQVWNPWNGDVTALPTAAGGDAVSLTVEAHASVLLRLVPGAAPERVLDGARKARFDTRELDAAPWSVTLAGRGLHGRRIERSFSWGELHDLTGLDEVADFAGSIRYETTLDIPQASGYGGPLLLDLGEVRDAAIVQVDDLPPCVMPEGPFVVDLGDALVRPGPHRLRITVANVAENALRDPANPGGLPIPGRRLTRLPTGLLGPLRLRTAGADERVLWRLPRDGEGR